jgi:hypothetical protein
MGTEQGLAFQHLDDLHRIQMGPRGPHCLTRVGES